LKVAVVVVVVVVVVVGGGIKSGMVNCRRKLSL
jgi:hypothetical protein